MKSTIKTGLFSAMTALGTVALLTSANAAGFAELDANTDGQLDLAELQASFGENAQATLDAYDTDADTMISVEEAEAMAAQSGAATTEGAPAAATTEAPAADATASAATEETTIAPGTEAEANAAAATEAPAAAAVTEGAEAGATAVEDAADDAAATMDDAIRSNSSGTAEPTN